MQKLKTFPYHTIGIILFFITHGYSEYVGLIPITDLLGIFGVLLLSACLLFVLFNWKQKRYAKAGLLTTYVLTFYLFYGAISDNIKQFDFLSELSRYRYLVPIFLLSLVFLFWYLKRSAATFQKLTLYLNSVLIVFILFDCVSISMDTIKDQNEVSKNSSFTVNDEGRFDKKPDIYFILLDGYNGSDGLKTYLKYDNSQIENFLRSRGFFVAASPSSNYDMTNFSMASIFSMDCLDWVNRNKSQTASDLAKAARIIADNRVFEFLQSKGYKLYNYSIFDIGDQPTPFNTGLMSFKLQLITAKTLFNRMEKDLIWIVQAFVAADNDWLADKFQNKFKKGNEMLITLTKELPQIKSDHPRFVYTHLMMPHAPFLYDSLGTSINLNSFDNTTTQAELNHAYLQYLVFTNKRASELIQYLLEKTNGQAVIILMSDHGFRKMSVNGKDVPAYNNFNAVYIPGSDYRFFYDTITNVNQFRAVFNTMFDMKLPMLPDSCR